MKYLTLIFALISIQTVLSAQEKYLVFGKGGGVAGMANVYKVYLNGEVQKGSGMVELNYLQHSKIKKSAAKKMFCRISKLEITSFNHPGNMYYFIVFFENDKAIKYTWGAADFKAPEELTGLYNDAVSQLSKLDYNTNTNN